MRAIATRAKSARLLCIALACTILSWLSPVGPAPAAALASKRPAAGHATAKRGASKPARPKIRAAKVRAKHRGRLRLAPSYIPVPRGAHYALREPRVSFVPDPQDVRDEWEAGGASPNDAVAAPVPEPAAEPQTEDEFPREPDFTVRLADPRTPPGEKKPAPDKRRANDYLDLWPAPPVKEPNVLEFIIGARLIRPKLSDEFGVAGSFGVTKWYASVSTTPSDYQPFPFLRLGFGFVAGSSKPQLHMGGTAQLDLDIVNSVAFIETREWMPPWYRVESSLRLGDPWLMGAVLDSDYGVGPRLEYTLDAPADLNVHSTLMWDREFDILNFGFGLRWRPH